MPRAAFAVLALALAASGCHAPVPPAEPPAAPALVALDSMLERVRLAHETPALAAAVVRSSGALAAGAAGTRYRGSPAAVTTAHRFHIGSNAKAMTAVMLATLVEEGRLGWTSTVAEVFPELSEHVHPLLREATLEQFLSHRAGVPAFTSPLEFRELTDLTGTPIEQRWTLASLLLQQEPAAAPGVAYQYSNAGYAIAAAMAERVTGESWEALMRARVFAPLGIATAGYGWPAVADTTQPRGHLALPVGPPAPQRLDDPYRLPVFLAPAGDVYLSVEDYARFLQRNLQGLRGVQTLLEPATWRRLHTPHENYGLGWGVTTDRNGRIMSMHAGSAGTFFIQAVLLHEHDLAAFVVANAADAPTQRAISETVRLLLERFSVAE